MPHTRYGIIEHLLRPRRTLILRLYTNELTPSRAHSLADFTEASFPGYKPITLRPADWLARDGDPVILACPKQSFILAEDCDLPAIIHGHYLTDGDEVVYVEPCKPARLSIAHSRIDMTPTLGEKVQL